MTRPLFVSYTGRVGGNPAQGWAVISDRPALATSEDMTALMEFLEAERKFDVGTLILVSFQRLEKQDQ